MTLTYTPFRTRAVLLLGVMRRFLLTLFRPAYVRASVANRTGQCNRCGVCCHLVANKCAALHLHADGNSTCRLYNICRPLNCYAFPITPKDLRDRDLIAPETPCGYSWPEIMR